MLLQVNTYIIEFQLCNNFPQFDKPRGSDDWFNTQLFRQTINFIRRVISNDSEEISHWLPRDRCFITINIIFVLRTQEYVHVFYVEPGTEWNEIVLRASNYSSYFPFTIIERIRPFSLHAERNSGKRLYRGSVLHCTSFSSWWQTGWQFGA